jgi:ABC-2 type transport system ATP-binding protein
MNIIRAENLHKNFGRVAALDGADIEVNEGEVYGFIGPNGAGKSTTIRVLLGILKASSGSARVFGKDAWTEAVEIHKRIAYVPGDVNLWPNLSGGEVIDLFVRMKKNHNKQYRDELAERFDFDPTKKCGTYSKGNRQKVALIAAFSSDADLYILDEPTSGLDPLMEMVFQDCVRKVKAEGKSVFLSSHILSEVEQLCDRISIIRKGKIIDSGTLRELRHLTRNNVHAESSADFEGLEKLRGVYGVTAKDGAVSFSMDNSETENVLKFLTEKGIKRLTSTPPTLEELFMSHYDA